MPNFPSQDYTFTSLYVLGNGYYIDFRQNGPEYLAVTKSPEGAIINEGQPSFSSEPKILVNEAVTILSDQLGIADLQVTEIIEKTPPPVSKSTPQFKIMGKVVDKNGNPITRAQIQPTLITFPPPAPPAPGIGNPNVQDYTDFQSEVFTLGSPIVVAPFKVDDEGNFEYEYRETEEIDFSKSFIGITANEFFPKNVGPTLTKTGETTIIKRSQAAPFTGSTSVVDTQLILQGDGNYKSTITLKNSSTGETSTGEGISPSRETAKKIARSKAEQGFAQVNEEEETLILGVYDLGRITLDSAILDLSREEAEIKKQVQEVENIQIEIAAKKDLPFEAKLAALFNKQKERLKQLLIPAILAIIAKFGPAVVHGIVNRKVDALSDKVCPPKEEILAAIRKRNQLVRQLNNIYKIVRVITKILKITSALIIGLKIAFRIAKFLPLARPTLLIADGGAIIKRRLEIAGVVVNILTVTAVVIGAALGIVIELLRKLDFLIQDCSEQIDPETGDFVIPFVQINDELNSFIDSTTGQLDEGVNPLNNEPLPYKGFTFEIKQDTSQDFQYPKRYAIARNIQGIQVLRSESSFASSPEILIEELKFIIDRDNLRAD